MRVHASHPQLRKAEERRTVTVFDCPGCGDTFYVRGAYVQPDGSLRCFQCSEKTEPPTHGPIHNEWPVDFSWCPQCRQAKPHSDFEKYRSSRHQWCLDCAAAEKVVQKDRATACAQCGTEFAPSRRDARFCSGRCRVAAHRAAAHPITVDLVRAEDGDGYATPDGRWLVYHDPESSCAPKRWWWVSDTTHVFIRFAVPTLDDVKREIAQRLT